MNITIVLLEEYESLATGKKIDVRKAKYLKMVEDGIKMRVFSPERLKAGTAKANYVFEQPIKDEEE